MDKIEALIESKEPIDFSLVQGGPLFQLFRHAHLDMSSEDLLARRIVIITLITWLPPLVLAVIAGQAFGGINVPFLLDIDAHIRCLLFVPLVIVAEVIVHRRLRPIVRQFLDQGIVAPEDRAQFAGIVSSAMRLRNSKLAEIILLALSYAGGELIWARHFALNVPTWFATPIDGQIHFTPAGYWYYFVSLFVMRFLLFRWYFRLIIWYRFLWQVSRRVPLQLNALHPDRAGGIGFLTNSAFAFTPVLLAHTVILAGVIGGKIWHEGASLPQFKLEIAAWIVFLILLVLIPLTFFVGRLAAARRAGLREYSILASRYVADFRKKWLTGDTSKSDILIGSSDIQSLSDLSNSFQSAREMLNIPFNRATVLRLAFVLLLPILPLFLTMISLEQLVDRALGVFL